MYKIQSGLIWLLVGSGSDDHNTGIRDIFIISGINLHLAGKRDAVRDIFCLAVSLIIVGVNENDLREQAALHQSKSRCGADKTTADNGSFSWIHNKHLFHLICISNDNGVIIAHF